MNQEKLKNMFSIQNVTVQGEIYYFNQYYAFPLSRSAPKLSSLDSRLSPEFFSSLFETSVLSSLPDGKYVGLSSCDGYTSTLGSGQKVLSYAYFTPWNTKIKQKLM